MCKHRKDDVWCFTYNVQLYIKSSPLYCITYCVSRYRPELYFLQFSSLNQTEHELVTTFMKGKTSSLIFFKDFFNSRIFYMFGFITGLIILCSTTSSHNSTHVSGNKEVNFPSLPSQWECKTDMDNAYRFGRIEVSCEGYSHPSDPYILKGSCGLEYTLELTEEGRRNKQGSWGSQNVNGFGGRKRQN